MTSSETRSSSSRSSVFSANTEDILKELNKACWACSSFFTSMKRTHVVPIGDTEVRYSWLGCDQWNKWHGVLSSFHIFHKQTKYLKSLALLPFPITGYENGMMLCPNCHALFDDMLNPGWIFVPADLEYFINYELEDRRTRQNIQYRTVSDLHEYLRHQIETGIQPANATMPTYT